MTTTPKIEALIEAARLAHKKHDAATIEAAHKKFTAPQQERTEANRLALEAGDEWQAACEEFYRTIGSATSAGAIDSATYLAHLHGFTGR